MKKPLITLVCLMAFIAALADNNYFTMGVNDTVYINPYTMINGDSLAVKANFSGRLDQPHVISGLTSTLNKPSNN